MSTIMFVGITILVFLGYFSVCSCYKILAVLPFPSKSHYAIPDPLLVRLAELGHHVTVYSPYPKKDIIPNYKDIDIEPCFRRPSKMLTIDFMSSVGSSAFTNLLLLARVTPKFEQIGKCEPLLELLNSDEKYDVFITENFSTDVLSLFAAKFQIPLISVIPNVMFPYLSSRMGNPDNPAYVPQPGSEFTAKMTFLNRVENTILYISMILVRKYYIWKIDEVSIRSVFESAPPIEDMVRNTSLLFIGTNPAINYPPVPLVPGVVDIGGIHIASAKPLLQNIEKFINESKHGVVYFCMGSLLRGETFPPEKREAFLYAFSKIPQRVLWKWEGDVLPGKSDNIMISKWMPQRDILAHPNVKLFISHGGLLGTSEAVYEGVPVLGIPIFGDQRTNIKSLEANGAGELLDYNEISKEVVLEKIQRLLNDPKYKENAKLLSDRYRDRPMSPLDTAVYWTEYVIRHKGAPHLRTAAADMPWYQYLLLDVIAFIVAVLVAGLLIIYYTTKFILRAIYGLICGGGAKKGSSKSDKKKRN
ncbi:UDP-glycosyltransferase UGT5-like isoform X15 [Planococcus citri]|uniref:UDP-glycosyltransferase UGT5-like isoform X15 n=1 Tax=Planococcus citri TaxID=170843 RepID=UPI0031F78858